MPASHLHETASLAATARAEGAAPFREHPAMIGLGAQGPDILFYHRALLPWHNRRLNQLGEEMHSRRTGDMIRAILRRARVSDARAGAWALGWIAHCAVDGTLHPYIYAYSERNPGKTRPTDVHLLLEQAMDMWLYLENGGRPPLRQYALFDRLAPDDIRIAASLMSHAMADVWPEAAVTETHIMQAVADMSWTLRLLNGPVGRYRMFRMIEKIIGHPSGITCHAPPPDLPGGDFLNLSHQTWENPWQKGLRSESVPDLVSRAVDKAAVWITGAAAYLDGSITLEEAAAPIGCVDYGSGLPCGEVKQEARHV